MFYTTCTQLGSIFFGLYPVRILCISSGSEFYVLVQVRNKIFYEVSTCPDFLCWLRIRIISTRSGFGFFILGPDSDFIFWFGCRFYIVNPRPDFMCWEWVLILYNESRSGFYVPNPDVVNTPMPPQTITEPPSNRSSSGTQQVLNSLIFCLQTRVRPSLKSKSVRRTIVICWDIIAVFLPNSNMLKSVLPKNMDIRHFGSPATTWRIRGKHQMA